MVGTRRTHTPEVAKGDKPKDPLDGLKANREKLSTAKRILIDYIDVFPLELSGRH